MLLKCNYCDPVVTRGEKQVKTIDTEIDDYIKDEKSKFYHTECYKLHLKIKKKMLDDEIEKLVAGRKSVQELEMKESISKDRFLKWVMDYYDSSLPSYYLKKLHEVRNGTYKGLNEKIDYETLLDIYTYMEKYLNKLAYQKRFESVVGRMNYDLAVVVGNYGDYKRFKEKQRQTEVSKNEIEESIARKKLTSEKQSPIERKEDKFNISDIIEDLLL